MSNDLTLYLDAVAALVAVIAMEVEMRIKGRLRRRRAEKRDNS